MPKFSTLPYVRPVLESIQKKVSAIILGFQAAATAPEQSDFMRQFNTLREDYMTQESICRIRQTIDTRDAFYEKEVDFFDENSPLLESMVFDYYRALLASSHREALEAQWGKQLFTLAELQNKVFSSAIIEDLQEENRLCTQYVKLKASAKLSFADKELNLSQMQPYLESKDRTVRKEAQHTVSEYYTTHEAEYDTLFDSLVKVRHTIATKLGFENYVPVGYAKMQRSDYDHHQVARYREQIHQDLVPFLQSLYVRQAKRLGLETMKFYDEKLEFTSGNALPKGTPTGIIEKARTMYKDLSPETHAFFEMMVDNELMDLLAQEGKAGGGYCSYINNYQYPFIFANFNGTSGDVDVLTHEAGHAFQGHLSSHFELPEYLCPTMEAAEIHSTAMEFFAWPWMKSFFAEDTDKYCFSHLTNTLLFIPYGVCVDEFQHYVYENPSAAPSERKNKWHDLEKKYLPQRDYDDDDFLNRGGFWFRQSHIFEAPFYYIDYTLANMNAIEFWIKSRQNKEEAWTDYLTLCKAGGSLPYLELLKIANLSNPFEPGTLKTILVPVKAWLEEVDDSTF